MTIEVSTKNLKEQASKARSEAMKSIKSNGLKGFPKYGEVALYYARGGCRIDAISYGFPSIKIIKDAMKEFPDHELFIEGSIDWYENMEELKNGFPIIDIREYWQVFIVRNE